MEYLDIRSSSERIILDLRKRDFKNVILLGHYSYKEAKKNLEMHRHKDMIEICFLETGIQNYQVGNQNYLLKGGDVLITPPNTLHGTNNYPEEKGSLFWLIIKVTKEKDRLLNLTRKESALLIDELLSLDTIHFKGTPDIKKILMSVFSSYNQNNNLLSRIEITNALLSFLLKVIQSGIKANVKNKISKDIEFCLHYIEKNIFRELYIHDLAKKVSLSDSRFKHKFKHETGLPPNEYIIKQKLKKAKELIKENKLTITNISYDLGFSTISYFSTVFKKFNGISPSEYKKKLQINYK